MSSKVYATVNQFVGHNGQSVWLGAGDEYDSSDAIVRANPDMFTKHATGPAAVAEERQSRGRRSNT
jgi:hypothetical protein